MPNPREKAVVEGALTRLALPAMLQGLLFTIVFVVDTMMVSSLGPSAIAAVGAAGPVIWSISALLFAFSRATTALVANSTGAGRLEDAKLSAGQSLFIALALGLLSALVFALCSSFIMLPFNLESEVHSKAASYLSIVGIALVFSLPGHVLKVVFHALGDTRTPLFVGALGNIVNLVGDYLLIFGFLWIPALGVSGAALATAACRVLECILLLAMFCKKAACPSLDHVFTIHGPTLRRLFRVAFPAVAEAASFHGGYLLFSCLVSWLGTVALAAHRICLSVEALAFMPATGLAVAAATHTGQSLGAGRADLAEYGVSHVRKRAAQYMAFVALCLLLFPELLVYFYTSDALVYEKAVLCLRIGAFELVSLGLTMALTGALQGAGDTRSPFLITTFGIWLIRLPLTGILAISLSLGLPGVWLATAIDWLIRALLVNGAIEKGSWKHALAPSLDAR